MESAEGFWNNMHSAQHGGITWTDSGHGLIWKDFSYQHEWPLAIHWTINASQWIGQADFLFFSGHGSPEEIIFTDDYDNHVSAEEMMLNETGRVKWAVFDSCKTLNEDNWSILRWLPSFSNGLHMLLGWQTDVAATSVNGSNYRGEAFAELMKGDYPDDATHNTISDAWYYAGVYTYPRSSSFDVWNAVMYWNECENDHLPGYSDLPNCINPGASQSITWRARLVFAQNRCSTNSLPVNMTIDNFSLVASVPIPSNNTMIYMPVKSGYTKEWISSLAKNLGMSGDIRETEDAFYGGDKDAEQYLFVVQKNSSMILFRKTNSSLGTVLSDTQSISAANTFLRKNNLLSSENLEPRVVNNRVLSFTRSGDYIGEWKTNVVVYPQLVNGLPVFSAQFFVEVDSDGNIIGLYKNWGEYEPYKEISQKSLEDAFSEFRTRWLESIQGIPEKVTVTRVSLGYQMNRSGDIGGYLQPVYIFEGNYQQNDSIESFEPMPIAAYKEGVQDVLIPSPPGYMSEVTSKVTGNFSAQVSSTICSTEYHEVI